MYFKKKTGTLDGGTKGGEKDNRRTETERRGQKLGRDFWRIEKKKFEGWMPLGQLRGGSPRRRRKLGKNGRGRTRVTIK